MGFESEITYPYRIIEMEMDGPMPNVEKRNFYIHSDWPVTVVREMDPIPYIDKGAANPIYLRFAGPMGIRSHI